MSGKLTPLLRQYLDIKDKYNDCLVFFRLGDFYELFFEDAEVSSKVLGITLKRDKKPGGFKAAINNAKSPRDCRGCYKHCKKPEGL